MVKALAFNNLLDYGKKRTPYIYISIALLYPRMKYRLWSTKHILLTWTGSPRGIEIP